METPLTNVEVAVQPPYSVLVGDGAFEKLAGAVEERDVAVIADGNVSSSYGRRLVEGLEGTGQRVELLTVPPGEGSKSLEGFGRLLRRLVTGGFDRSSAVIGLGGGVTTDLAGFVAASFLRGVPYYACPTSLLAMVDASVGGKTGINLPEGKNLVGAFWQPRLVAADVGALATLPEREFRQGAVELFKHGLLADEELLTAPGDPEFRPGGNPAVLARYVARSVEVKAKVVAGDEREVGPRAFLNLGHTLGHALEAASGGRLSHGDAIAYGLLFAARLGAGRGWHDFTGEVMRLLRWLAPAPLPVESFEELEPFILRDKKNAAGKVRFVLLREPKRPVLVSDVEPEAQERAWLELRELVS